MPFYYRIDNKTAVGVRTADRLLALRAHLRNTVPQRTLNDTLLIATWNIREFDSPAYGPRVEECFYYIAEIVSSFDLVAIQEVRDDLKALDKLMRILGGRWKYVVTDVTEGTPGNGERMAFLYDSRKVRFGGLAGELVIPPEEVGNKIYRPSDQLYRTPAVVGFQAGWFKFMISTVHIVYGEGTADNPDRLKEIDVLANFLANRVKQESAWASNLILLGDFNIFSRDDKTYGLFEKHGFSIPNALKTLPPTNLGKKKRYYDQIAFYFRQYPELTANAAGIIEYYKIVFRDDDYDRYVELMGEALEKNSKGKPRTDAQKLVYYLRYWRTFQMSDHMPMWTELRIDFAEEYLKAKAQPAQP